jgi:hypothetical protein
VEWKNTFFKSSPVDEYHMAQMNSEKVFFGCIEFSKVQKITKIHQKVKEHDENFASAAK